MTKRQTILIAAMINAGLLMLLCIAALSSQDELATELPSLAIQSHEEEVIPFFPEPQPVGPSEVVHSLPPLVVPQEAPVMVLPALPPSPVSAIAAASPTPAPSVQEVTVRAGDTLEKLARTHKISVDDLIKFNQLPSTFLRVGQVLRVPAGHVAAVAPNNKPTAAVPVGTEYYVVKAGDSPWTIAMKHHMKVEELLRLNQLDEGKARKLKPGDRIKIR